MPEFKISYEDSNGEWQEELHVFEDFIGWSVGADNLPTGPTLRIPAKKWAEDLAYGLADKGCYEVEEVHTKE